MATGDSERKALTEKQETALEAITAGGGVKEVADALRISPTGAHSHIKALQKKGYIDENLQVIGAPRGSNGRQKDEAPEAPPIVGSNGTDAFALDTGIASAVKVQREELATTIGQIDGAIAEHEHQIKVIEGRVTEAQEEAERHEVSIRVLTDTKESAKRALESLPAA